MPVGCSVTISFFLLAFVLQASAKPVYNDSCVIYQTKQQFDNDSGTISRQCLIQEKEPITWSEFKFQARGRIRIKEIDGEKKIFNPGSIFGFSVNGIKFIYIPGEDRYMAMLGSLDQVTFLINRSVKMSVIEYLYPRNNLPRQFTRKHIRSDFGDDTILLSKLLSLHKKLREYNRVSGFNSKDYLKCRNIISAGLD